MTAPDPRPYASPTDLVTAADVLAWLGDLDEDGIMGAPPVWAVVQRLRERLDRERRQACRRGALVEWQEFRRWVHGWGYGWGDGDGIALDVLSRALAFRAAARAK